MSAHGQMKYRTYQDFPTPWHDMKATTYNLARWFCIAANGCNSHILSFDFNSHSNAFKHLVSDAPVEMPRSGKVLKVFSRQPSHSPSLMKYCCYEVSMQFSVAYIYRGTHTSNSTKKYRTVDAVGHDFGVCGRTQDNLCSTQSLERIRCVFRL